jgi:hypothetical protein
MCAYSILSASLVTIIYLSQVVQVSVMARIFTSRNILIELLPGWVPLSVVQPILTAQLE